MYSLKYTNGNELLRDQAWNVIARELMVRGIHHLMVEAIQAWFDMNRGKEFVINEYTITEA